jgi:PKD repeat protein
MMKKFLASALAITMLVLFMGIDVQAQISQGGTPPSFIERSTDVTIDSRSFAAPDVAALLAEDEENMNMGIPLRVGVSVIVDLDINNAGTWTALSNGGKIWRLELSAEGAIALGVYFDRFIIPEGGELYLYDKTETQILGAFTELNNHEDAKFATQLIGGEKVTLEYYMPNASDDMPELSISDMAYNYKYSNFPYLENADNTSSLYCMININCEEGDDWQKEKKGSVKQYMKIGWAYYLCSGTLLNNTSWDRTPYVLTAAHCGHGASTSDLNQWVFYFNYEASSCTGNYGPSNQTMTGATLRAWNHIPGPEDIDGSDFFLMELKSSVPTSYDPYFNGWDRRDIPGDYGVSIHHPAGDITKISTYETMVSSTWWTGLPSHWQLWWVETPNGKSITEGGSSGSPVFNEHHNVIGDLTGGYTSNSCETPSPSFYGKVYWSWDKNGNTAEFRLKDWLDADNLGWEYCDGVSWENSPPIVEFATLTTTVNMGEPVQFTDLSENKPNEWEWTFDGAEVTTSNEENPVVTYVEAGFHSVTLVATNPDGTDNMTKTDYIEVIAVELPVVEFNADTTVISPWETIDFYDLSTGDPFEWSWEFEGGNPSSSTVQNPQDIKYYSSGLYDVTLTAKNGGGSTTLVKEGFINVVWVGIDENGSVQNLKLYPNPTKGEFALEFMNIDYRIAEIKVFDMAGNLVKTVKSSDNTKVLSINIESRPEGVYYLNIKVDEKIYVKKISLVK